MDTAVSPLRSHQQHLRPFDGEGSPRSSDDGTRERQSPVELTQSRENSVHGPSSPLGGAMHAMSPEMQLSLYPLFFCEDWHDAAELCRESARFALDLPRAAEVSRWRMKERMKTTSVALVMCLNIGVDPPDVLKISPCARAECWINPLAMQPAKALEAIGKALQAQYERWQPRAKYKMQLDPTVEDVKKLCQSCRRNARNERVLLHYNGHGVPRPTANGEIWVFNKSYTQYIPLSVYDLQSWTGNPAIYVFDCGGAGVLVDAFLQLAQRGGLAKPSGAQTPAHGTAPVGADASGETAAAETNASGRPTSDDARRTRAERGEGDVGDAASAAAAAAVPRLSRGVADATMGGAMPLGAGMSEVILLAACGADETLPQSAELPADVFSACLTTPIKIALRWFCARSALRRDGVDATLIDAIPGQQNNRKTPLGELNWIFTAVTDTIAWNALPRPLFQRLFRQDLLVASLFRNFLLAERVMRASNCTPVSCPAMPPTYQHPMWHAWDAAVETCLLQMPGLLNGDARGSGDGSSGAHGAGVEFAPSPFFTEQLTAFEVWLERGSARKPPPEQLPIVLQVLLSQSHRLRALVLLGRFLDMGPWAVDLALSVGIFPYVLKLLQTTAPDLRQILVFIWTKILALDASCQADLVKDGGHAYFARFLDAPDTPSEERAMAAFVLSAVCDGHPKGQAVCAASGVAGICLARLAEAASPGPSGSPSLVRWLCLCLGKLWENARDAQAEAFVSLSAPEAVAALLGHPAPDARAAAVYALGALVYVPEEGEPRADEAEAPDTPPRSPRAASVDGAPSGGAAAVSAERETPSVAARSAPNAFGALERAAAERAVACQILPGVTDASPGVRAETAVAIGRLACAHARSFQEAAEAFERAQSSEAERRRREPIPRRSSRDDHRRRGGSMSALDEEAEELSSSTKKADALDAIDRGADRGPDASQPRSLARSGSGSSARSGSAHHMGAFGSSTSLASAGSTGSLAGLSGSQGRNAGVYAASDLGPFEPAFGPEPAYRDPSADALECAPGESLVSGASDGSKPSESDGERVDAVGQTVDRHPAEPRGSADDADREARAASGSAGTPAGGYASADAARVGGGLYRHLLERLADLARDPSPRVAVTAQRALLATGLDPGHALLRTVVGREALRAADGSAREPAAGSAAGNADARAEASGAFGSRPSAASAASDVSDSDAFPAFERDFRRDVSDGSRSAAGLASPFGHGGKSPSWHQKLSMAAARLLGSPQSARGSAESVSSLGGGGGGDARDSDLRRSSSSRGIMASPLSGRSTSAAMKRVATAHAPLRQMSASGGAFSSTNVSFVDERLGGDDARARASSDGSSLDASVRGGGGEGDVTSTHAEPFASASQEARRRRAVPTSRAFARSREHFGRSLLEPPAGAKGHDGGYDDDDELFGLGADAPKHRRLDPEKRLARRRVAEERATRSARARADQLRFANPKLVSSIETFANGAAPSCLTLHPLTPTATVADTRGKVQTWDYETGRRLHAFDAGLPGRRIASAGLINDLDDAVLFTAGVDGSVRVWRDYACPGQESLVAALRALPLPALDATASSSSPPTVGRNAAERVVAGDAAPYAAASYRPRSRAAVVWQRQSGCLYASGDTHPVPLLRVWDMTRELCLESLQTQSPGTCLVAEGALLMAGALDGAVMSFDLRTPARLLSVVQTHRAPAVAILLQPGNVGNLVVTGAADGEMKFCDLRNAAKPFRTANAFRRASSAAASGQTREENGETREETSARQTSARASSLTSLVAHDHAPVIASGTTDRSAPVKLWDLEGNCFGSPDASSAKHGKSAFRASGFGTPRCMAFHPNLVMLGAGGGDGVASVWSAGDDRGAASAFHQRIHYDV